MTWTGGVPELAALSVQSRALLDTLAPMDVPAGAILFQPGDSVKGYVPSPLYPITVLFQDLWIEAE